MATTPPGSSSTPGTEQSVPEPETGAWQPAEDNPASRDGSSGGTQQAETGAWVAPVDEPGTAAFHAPVSNQQLTGEWVPGSQEDGTARPRQAVPGVPTHGEAGRPTVHAEGQEQKDLADRPAEQNTRGERFRLLQFHARGGMGEVWAAEDCAIGRTVALKRIRQGREADATRFFLEAQITGQLEHPGVVPVHQLGHDPEGQPYYVMKFIEGRTLKTAIKDYHEDKSPENAREVLHRGLLQTFVHICQTMAYAHNRGVIHRDLKPENVMVGAYGETLVLDWGLAKSRGGELGEASLSGSVNFGLSGDVLESEAGSIKGTLSYISPEAAAGKVAEVDQVSDIYLLGGILYEMLTGQPPRTGKKASEVLAQARTTPPPPPRQLNAGIPRPLDAICMKALALRKADRYQSASALAEDLERYLAGEPVSAYRETLLERATRWCYRHRVALSRLAVAAAFAGLLWFGWDQWQKIEAAREAERQASAERLRQAEEEKHRVEEEKKQEAARADRLQKQKEAQAQLQQLRHLAEETRYFAASTDAVGENAPFFDSDRAVARGQAALALAKPWGPNLDQLPLENERKPLRQELYDLLVLLAQTQARPAQPPEDLRQGLQLLDQAAVLQEPTRGWHRLRADIYQQLQEKDRAAEQRQKAARKGLATTALDHFLAGEQLRTARSDKLDPQKSALRALLPEAERLKQAIGEYQQAVNLDPEHFWSHFQLGRCYLALGQGDRALERLSTCVALRPGSPWGWAARGLALSLLERYEEAGTDLDRALVLDPEFRPAQLNRGVLHWKTMKQILNGMNGGKKKDPDALTKARKERDLALLDFAAVLAPPDELRLAEAAFSRAQLYLEQGEIDKALADFETVVRERPHLKTVFLLRAQVWLLKDQPEKALADLDRYLATSGYEPRSAHAHEQRGRHLRWLALDLPRDQRRTGLLLAKAQLETAVKLKARSVGLFDDLGGLNEHLGDFAAAIKAYTEALTLAPEDARLLVKRGWAWEKLDPPDFNKARVDFTAAQKIAPADAEAHAGLGYMSAALKQDREARRQAHQALLMGAGDYLILHNVACIYGKLSQQATAAKNLKLGEECDDLALDQLQRGVDLWKKTEKGPDPRRLMRVEPSFPPSLTRRPEFVKLAEGK